MSYTYSLLLVFCLVACNTGGIDFDTDELKPFQEEVYELMDEEFGTELEHGDFVVVHWTVTPCPYSDAAPTAVIYRGRCYHGITFNCDEIYVAERDTFWESALVHELGHCVRFELGMGGDMFHEDSEFWQRVVRTNSILVEWEL